jgi:hypothetical protein
MCQDFMHELFYSSGRQIFDVFYKPVYEKIEIKSYGLPFTMCGLPGKLVGSSCPYFTEHG